MALQRVLCSVSRRAFSTARVGGLLNKGADKLPNPLEHASGLERKQLLAELSGNEDPFDMNIQKRGACTKDQPHVVKSHFHERLVGCICEEDSENVVWMWLRQSEPKRCACGYWFKLEKGQEL